MERFVDTEMEAESKRKYLSAFCHCVERFKLLHAVGKARCGAARSLMPTGKALDDDVDYFRQVD